MAPKRKLDNGKSSSSKAQKKNGSNTESSSALLSTDEMQNLVDEIIQSSKYNNLVPLLGQYEVIKTEIASKKNDKVETAGRRLSLSLFKAFQHLLKEGHLVAKKSYDDNRKLVVKWLINKYDSFKDIACDFIQTRFKYETSLQLDLLEIVLNLIRLESQYLKSGSNDLFFPNITYKKLCEALLLSKSGEVLSDGSSDSFLVLEFIEKFAANWDLQFYFINNLNEVLENWKKTKTDEELRSIFSKFFTIMKGPLLFTQEVDELEKQQTWIQRKLPSIAYKQSQFKTQYQKAFLQILSYPLSVPQYKSILLILHKRIIPNMAQPQSIMDFLTDCYNISDDPVIPILALNSLYELMRKYNLEYPDFYTKLYSLLTPELLYTRYRSRFFRLCDLFLTSTHLSANLVASFIKKLARLSIGSSASGVVITIPFIYNLLKRHPTCMIMLHNTEASKDEDYVDPYNNDEVDPLKTDAIHSSLWEMETLMSHYHPNIATLAKIFGEPFRKHSYNMEDFLDWSYLTLLDSEKNRRYKTMAALEYEEFDHLFEAKDEKKVYAEGWTL
ncbi:CBF/Mak21 family-domain-containing protein [Scheffersomyces xylosifermentans]|uniref:CBF/Mak21 family-domain-containing protein n=1 Tax=Scheffersomyces xylosifermentans TaxID=1304137 RepID=UPI00315D71F0